MEGLGIEPVFFDEVYYCQLCMSHAEYCGHGVEHIQRISGTEARTMFGQGMVPPDWYMRKEVSGIFLEGLRQGDEVFAS